MARSTDPTAQYTIKPHVTHGYTYASTQPPYTDPITGEKRYRHVHWGTIQNGVFIPGTRYLEATSEEREHLVFPENMDMRKAKKLDLKSDASHCLTCNNRLYGHIWLLEQIAERTGIRDDLMIVFGGDQQMVNDIMTLAVFPYLTKFTYNRVARWQNTEKSPSYWPLTPSHITRITQGINERHRMDLLHLRSLRLEKDEFCAVDSTTRTAFGSSLAEIKWGKNKELLPLPVTMEVVVYTLTSHMPVYYRSFPGNIPDSRTLDIILKDLADADFQDLILITDRGYDSLHNLETYIAKGTAMIMCVKTGQELVAAEIAKLGDFSFAPESMSVDPEEQLYYKQYDITEKFGGEKKADRLKLNLYFDPVRRSYELRTMDIARIMQRENITRLMENKIVVDVQTIKKDFYYYKTNVDPATKTITSFTFDCKKFDDIRKDAGFFALMTHKVDMDAITALQTYSLRDEQEKYFQQMKDQQVSDRQRTWSEEGKIGRLFILFVALILSSYARHIWKTTKLHDIFTSSLEMFDEMRSIRCIEHPGSDTVITPFVGKQLTICDEFDFKIPEKCIPISYVQKEQPKRKRGRPKKNAENSTNNL